MRDLLQVRCNLALKAGGQHCCKKFIPRVQKGDRSEVLGFFDNGDLRYEIQLYLVPAEIHGNRGLVNDRKTSLHYLQWRKLPEKVEGRALRLPRLCSACSNSEVSN